MKRILAVLVISLVVSIVTGERAFAQSTAQISGAVQDPSGAVLPGVDITATQTDTGVSRTTITNETGSFVLPNLPTGPYRLEATLPGFSASVQTGIILQVNSSATVNFVLQVGQVSEQIEVQANASQVETRSTAVGQVMENERILELPLQGRVVTDLITLSGGAVPGRPPGGSGWNQGTTAATYVSIAGGQSFGVMYALDGTMHNNGFDGSPMPMPFPDALQEFKVDASGIGAAGGTRGSGGQVNAVTRSGTNQFHGSAFEFVRNYKFNARNFFALQRDTLKRNQFGGTLGGPIVKNKLFFFGGYQQTITRSDGDPTTSFVPTPEMMAGDWTTYTSPACNASGRQINLAAPFSNNRINPALYSKPALFIASKLPSPQNSCGELDYSIPDKSNEIQLVGKIDYQQSPNHSMFGRYVATRFSSKHAYELTDEFFLALSGDYGGFKNRAQSYALGSTYLMGPNTINSFRVSVNRVEVFRPGVKFFSAPDIGINAYSYVPDGMSVSVSGGGGFGFGGLSTSPARTVTNAYQMGDDISLVKGNHQLSFGTNLANWRTYMRCFNVGSGSYTFNGTATGLGMADFLTGKLTSLSQQSPTQSTSLQWYVGSWVQDVWKVSPKLTLNVGLRWEPYIPLSIGHGEGATLREGVMYNFSDDRFTRGVKSTVYPNAPAGLLFPGDPGFPEGASIHKKWGTFAPRVGLAWDVQGDGRTSIRASYGMAYDFSGSNTFNAAAKAPPVGKNSVVTSPAGGFEDPWRDFPGGNPHPFAPFFTSSFPPLSQYYAVKNFDTSPPTVQTWNLTIQRQLSASIVASVSYLGNQAYHLWVRADANRALFFPGAPVNGVCTAGGFTIPVAGTTCSTTANTDQRRRLFLQNPQEGQYYGNVTWREDSGTQSYNGLLLSVQRRAARGLNLSGNYTWSHCLGDEPTANGVGLAGPGYLDLNDRAFDRGNCPVSDRRHVFNGTMVVSTPQFANPTLRMLGTGWQLSSIYRRSTGSFLRVTTGVDRQLSGQSGSQRPVQVLENPYLDRDSLNYLNPAAFVQPALGTIGNMRPYNIEGPGTWQLDFGLTRAFVPRETQKLELRVEAFNVTNSLRKGNPTTAINSNTFGQINTSSDARIMQFALKYTF